MWENIVEKRGFTCLFYFVRETERKGYAIIIIIVKGEFVLVPRGKLETTIFLRSVHAMSLKGNNSREPWDNIYVYLELLM